MTRRQSRLLATTTLAATLLWLLIAPAQTSMELAGTRTLVDDEIEFHDVLIEEREKGIREIQNQVAEVGEIFQDLAVLVNEQGDMVDDIESHITSTHANTDQAGREIGRAASHQKGARNRLCVSAVLCVVMLVILLIIFNA